MGFQNILKNKKGGLPDAFFLIVAFFAIALVFILMFVVVSYFNDDVQSSDLFPQVSKDISSTLVGKYANLFDKMYLFIVVGLGFAVLAGAWFIASHPALFWISTPILAFTIWMGALFSNIYTEIVANEQIATYALSFPSIAFIFEHFAIVITIYVLMLALALYAKPKVQY